MQIAFLFIMKRVHHGFSLLSTELFCSVLALSLVHNINKVKTCQLCSSNMGSEDY